jgi:peptidoglycan/xylan/chitin deacetylase (PgdA/CDA1 family)
MYHELETPGRRPVRSDPGYVRYVVNLEQFMRQIDHVAASGLQGLSVGGALQARVTSGAVVLTFDDGCETDAAVAAPLLSARGLNATFYVVSEWIGTAGFMTEAQLRQLIGDGFEIGSHSASHAFLSDLDDRELRRELGESRARLEAILHRPVLHLSCPGGRWSPRVAEAARAVGYRTVATSRPGLNAPEADLMALARNAILRPTTDDAFARVCEGRLARSHVVWQRILDSTKAAIGTSAYEAVREAILRRPS